VSAEIGAEQRQREVVPAAAWPEDQAAINEPTDVLVDVSEIGQCPPEREGSDSSGQRRHVELGAESHDTS
jgi:hypothetical protein